MTNHLKTENKVLMYQAREALKGKWGLAIGATIVYMLIFISIQLIPYAGQIISLLISGAMLIGLSSFSLSLSRKRETTISEIFIGFQKFGVGLGAFSLTMIFIILWSLLLIIPGIIAAFSYSMTYFIIVDKSSIGPLEAIKLSKEIMRGNKWKFFCLNSRFIGWLFLCLFTFGIGFLCLSPYFYISYAQFYDDIKESYSSNLAKDQISDS